MAVRRLHHHHLRVCDRRQGGRRDVPTVIIVDGDVSGGQLAAVANPDMPDLAIDIGFHRSLAIILLVSHWSRC